MQKNVELMLKNCTVSTSCMKLHIYTKFFHTFKVVLHVYIITLDKKKYILKIKTDQEVFGAE